MRIVTSRAMFLSAAPVVLLALHPVQPRPTSAPAAGSVVACEVTGKMADGVAEEGKALYTKKCASCHGATGDGKGVAARRLETKVAAWDAARWAKTTDEEKFKATKCGGVAIGMSEDMPDYPDYSDKEIWDMLAYSATLVTK